MEEEIKYSEVVIREVIDPKEIDSLIVEADFGFIDTGTKNFYKAYLKHKDVGFYVELEGYYHNELIDAAEQVFRYYLEHQYTW